MGRECGDLAAESPYGDEHVIVLPNDDAKCARDEEFAQFITVNQRSLLRAAWLLCGDAHVAEEMAQQAMVRTYVAWPRARREDPLAYARRVLVNLRIDAWRRRGREQPTSPESLPDFAADGGSRVDDRDRITRALGVLSPRQRRVVVLRYLLDLPEAEVAADLGVGVGTVKSTASRAVARMRAVLNEDESIQHGGT